VQYLQITHAKPPLLMNLSFYLRLYLFAITCFVSCKKVVAVGKPMIHNMQLGKETVTIAGGTFSILSIKSFESLLPENQVDMTLLVKHNSVDSAFHWPSISIDSIVYENKKSIYTRFDTYKRFNRITEGFEPKSLPTLACGYNVKLIGLYFYLNPVAILEGNYAPNDRSNFIPGNLKAKDYKIFTTIQNEKSIEIVPYCNDLVCFQVKLISSNLPGADLEYIENLRSQFAFFGVCANYAGKVPTREKFLPLHDETFLNKMITFGKTSLVHKKLLAKSISHGFLRQKNNSGCYIPGNLVAAADFEHDDLFFSLYSDLVSDIYAKDRYIGLFLLLEEPGALRVPILQRIGIKDPQSCRGNIVPTKFLKK